MTLNNVKQRFGAFTAHLVISAVFVGAMAYLVCFVWFPNKLIYVGAIEGLTILVLVDLIVGPILTLVVFDKSKANLTFDLSCIALMQIACFVYGVYLIHNERPILHVLKDDGVAVFTLGEAKRYDLVLDYGFFSQPTFLYLDVPFDRDTMIQNRVTYEFSQGRSYALKTESHIPATQISNQQFKTRLEYIKTGLSTYEKALIANSEQKNKPQVACSWLPLFAVHSKNSSVCLTHKEGIVDFYRDS